MPFNFYHDYYGYIVGTQIRGQIGKKYIYQVRNNQQRKYLYKIPYDPKSPAQLRMRDLIKKANQKWQSLTEQEKNNWRKLEPIIPTMSGFNYFVSCYVSDFL